MLITLEQQLNLQRCFHWKLKAHIEKIYFFLSRLNLKEKCLECKLKIALRIDGWMMETK